MREVIQQATEQEMRELADQFGFPAGFDAAELVELVNDRLTDGLDDLYDIPTQRRVENVGERTWWEPEEDPYNAVITACSVPPKSDSAARLKGKTIGIKDNIAVAGVPMHASSGVLHGSNPSADAAVTDRLRAAGAEITAKTTLDEFAVGGRGKTFKGLVKNPRDTERIAGGTSGGSGAAVAAGIVDAALGTDTGGSLRKPAAFCGCVAIKPTYGLVPLTGVLENTYTLDHVGPIAPMVKGAAQVLGAIAGKDTYDPASMAAAGRDGYSSDGFVDAVERHPPIEDLRLAVAKQGVSDPIEEEIAERHQSALDAIETAGATVDVVELPHLDAAKHIKNAISYAELAGFWRDGGAPLRRGGRVDPNDQVNIASRLNSATEPVNEFFLSRQLAGAYLLEKYGGRHYTRAHAARNVIRQELSDLLDDYDAIVTPTVPFFAPKIEEVNSPDFDTSYDGLSDDVSFSYGRYTKIGDITGVPSVTIPNDIQEGPAVGLQLMSQPFDDAALLGVSQAVSEKLTASNN